MTTLLDFLRTTEPTTNVWDYVSASRLSLWMKCPLAFKRRYVDGITSVPSLSMFVGKVVHAALEIVYGHRMPGTTCKPEDVKTLLQDAWDSVRAEEPFAFDDPAQEAKAREQVHNLVWTYLTEVNIRDENPLAVEKRYEAPLVDPLTGEDLGIPLVGIIDLLLETQDGPVLVDFKTAASASSGCAIQHELQLTAYAYLVRQVLGQEESALEIRQLVKTKTPKIVVHRFPPRTEDHFRRFFGVVREYLDSLDRGLFNYRPGFGCMMCDLAGMCSVS